MGWWQRLVERRIAAANARGQLSGLNGEGAPLPDRTPGAFVDPGTAVGFGIMAEAGVLPEEIVLKRRVSAVRSALAEAAKGAERIVAPKALADLELRLAIAEEARRKFLAD